MLTVAISFIAFLTFDLLYFDHLLAFLVCMFVGVLLWLLLQLGCCFDSCFDCCCDCYLDCYLDCCLDGCLEYGLNRCLDDSFCFVVTIRFGVVYPCHALSTSLLVLSSGLWLFVKFLRSCWCCLAKLSSLVVLATKLTVIIVLLLGLGPEGKQIFFAFAVYCVGRMFG